MIMLNFLHTCMYTHVGWRPAFKYYNQWVALVGALLCVAIMFVIRWYFALVTIMVVGALYMLVNTLKPGTLYICGIHNRNSFTCTYIYIALYGTLLLTSWMRRRLLF